MILLDNEIEYTADFDIEKVAKRVITHMLKREECPFETEVSIVITDNEGIREINREFRNIDSPTDVLSFPAAEYDKPADFGNYHDQTDCEHFNPETGNYILGDIMISADRIQSQAKEYGHTQMREFSFLLAHSILHLLGYDHELPEEALIMEQKQETYLTELQILR